MSNKMKSTLGQVGLLVLACAVIGIGAYHFGKSTSQEESITPAEPASAQLESNEQSKTIHVSPDGNDTNPGTVESPKKTVSAAVDSAKEGDTISVKPKSPPKASSGGG